MAIVPKGSVKKVATKLSNLASMFKKAVPTAAAFTPIPEGDYVGDLKEMKVELSKKNQRLQVVSTYEVVDPPDFAGKTIKRFDGLGDETQMGYFKGYCAVLGCELAEEWQAETDQDFMVELQSYLDAYIEQSSTDLWNITVKQSEGEGGKKYTNVYNNGLSELAKGEESTEGEAEEAVEEVEEVEEQAVEEAEEVKPMAKFTKPAAKVNGTSPMKKALPLAAKKAVVRR